MPNLMNHTLIAATLLAGATAIARPALANDLLGNDKHDQVELGQLPTSRNIVGGGAMVQQRLNERTTNTTYLQDSFAQQEPRGLVPVIVGSNNNDLRTIYVPADQAPHN